MNPALIFVALLMSSSIAQTASYLATDSRDESNTDKDDEYQETDVKEYSPKAALACTIFRGDYGCEAMCSMIGSIYGTVTDPATCKGENYCKCTVSFDATLDDLWKAKFNAKPVLKEIRKDRQLYRKVMRVLQKPLRTREQTLQDLESILTSEQLDKIKVKSTIAEELRVNGKPDRHALDKYVAKKLSSGRVPLHEKVILQRFADELKYGPRESSVQLIRQVRRSNNTQLNRYLNGLIKKRGIHEPSEQTYPEETFVEILDMAIADEALSPRPPKSATSKPTPSPGTA